MVYYNTIKAGHMSELFPRASFMNKPNTPYTKICSNCGQKKPLSAFLQVAGSHNYGNICSACRKTTLEDQGKEQEEGSKSTTGLKIDAKTKVKNAADNRKAFIQAEEEYSEERDKMEEKFLQHDQKIDKEKTESKKLQKSSSQTSLFNPTSAPAAPVFGSEAQKQAAGKVDFKFGTGDTYRTGKISTQSSVFRSLETWLGKKSDGKKPDLIVAAEKAALGSPEDRPSNSYRSKK
jgi:hypothetical protein